MAYLESLAPLGVRRAVLTGLDGLVIETLGRGAPPAEVLAAELASLVRHMTPLAEALSGEVRRFTLATENHEILALRVGEYVLGAVIERGMDRKAVGQELTRIALKVQNL
ncbi:roadblock/LC7 domain-containing protein [Thermus scotoductus]|uniref:roadblock/LC7 domain-containing protein n=1 Tax=Thermus scotoductus TaxID=37636 RepID=UPI00242EECDE|nr:roadblock/LC7 domain-containing protein [Thermus scotoductus]